MAGGNLSLSAFFFLAWRLNGNSNSGRNGDDIIGLWKVLKTDPETDCWQTGRRTGPSPRS